MIVSLIKSKGAADALVTDSGDKTSRRIQI